MGTSCSFWVSWLQVADVLATSVTSTLKRRSAHWSQLLDGVSWQVIISGYKRWSSTNCRFCLVCPWLMPASPLSGDISLGWCLVGIQTDYHHELLPQIYDTQFSIILYESKLEVQESSVRVVISEIICCLELRWPIIANQSFSRGRADSHQCWQAQWC